MRIDQARSSNGILVAVQQAQQKTKQQPKGKILEKVFPGMKLVFFP